MKEKSFDSQTRRENFLLMKMVQAILGLTAPPI